MKVEEMVWGSFTVNDIVAVCRAAADETTCKPTKEMLLDLLSCYHKNPFIIDYVSYVLKQGDSECVNRAACNHWLSKQED